MCLDHLKEKPNVWLPKSGHSIKGVEVEVQEALPKPEEACALQPAQGPFVAAAELQILIGPPKYPKQRAL